MTDKTPTIGERSSFARIAALQDAPIQGHFDLAHLKAIHAYIFQDSPEYSPGELRQDTPDQRYMKSRGLEAQLWRYHVSYRTEGIASAIETGLKTFGDPKALRGQPPEVVAAKLATLYGDLDHAHPFKEGNSRTLRVFTQQIASAAGYHLDWSTSAVSGKDRDRLYVARDLAVTERAFPGLNRERAASTPDRIEYEAWTRLAARFDKAERLPELIQAALRPERAQAFDTLRRDQATAQHPELAGTYERLDAMSAKARAEGLSPAQLAIAQEQMRQRASQALTAGRVPGAAERGSETATETKPIKDAGRER